MMRSKPNTSQTKRFLEFGCAMTTRRARSSHLDGVLGHSSVPSVKGTVGSRLPCGTSDFPEPEFLCRTPGGKLLSSLQCGWSSKSINMAVDDRREYTAPTGEFPLKSAAETAEALLRRVLTDSLHSTGRSSSPTSADCDSLLARRTTTWPPGRWWFECLVDRWTLAGKSDAMSEGALRGESLPSTLPFPITAVEQVRIGSRTLSSPAFTDASTFSGTLLDGESASPSIAAGRLQRWCSATIQL
mmetsp:Transcript_119540/g.372447  ORF Transcript_119540/g.372447 Transcript_119540/m.372447 type:complete len:243 (-) Transcript_119540:108-836(-)